MKSGVVQMVVGIALFGIGLALSGGPFKIALTTLGALLAVVGLIKWRTGGEWP